MPLGGVCHAKGWCDILPVGLTPGPRFLTFSDNSWSAFRDDSFRKILVSAIFPPVILWPEMAATILWAPGIFWFFLLENPHAHKIPRFRGGVVFFWKFRKTWSFDFHLTSRFHKLIPGPCAKREATEGVNSRSAIFCSFGGNHSVVFGLFSWRCC